MRDVSHKPNTLRTARAHTSITCRPVTLEAIRSGNLPKADPIGVAKIAGVQAAKNTSLMIPYCHQVPLDFVGVDVALEESSIYVSSEVKAVWKTGVEMEALVAASAAVLTLYDMLKAIDDTMEIGPLKLIEKRGGVSGFPFSQVSSLKVAVVVLSDAVSQQKRKDASGLLIKERFERIGVKMVEYAVLPDEQPRIEDHLLKLCTSGVDLIVTTGGTGVGPRDVTPEATRAVIERELPGVEEAMRSFGQERTPLAMLGRGVSGVRGSTVIVNLPGSVGGVADALDVLFPWLLHALDMIRGKGH